MKLKRNIGISFLILYVHIVKYNHVGIKKFEARDYVKSL